MTTVQVVKSSPKEPKPEHPGLLIFRLASAGRQLEAGDCIKLFDGSVHFVQYVNSSGAYIVALSSITRDIKGHTISFTSGGRTISAHSLVEVVHPRTLGDTSQEYARYVKMYRALIQGVTTDMAKRKGKAEEEQGATLDSFDNSPVIDPADGQAEVESSMPDNRTAGTKGMAKAAKAAKAPKAAKAKVEKAPKEVRQCVCGCGTETSGYFAPGHDARFHGWIKKLADGRILKNGKDAKSGEVVISAGVLKKLDLVDTKDGAKAKSPEYYKS